MKAIRALSSYITDEGELDYRRIYRSERLYQGMNGRYVERFYVSPLQSYIFKPVTHSGQEDREVWVYEQVLSRIPKVYPALIDKSEDGASGWAVFEDLGPLRHEHGPKTLLRMSKLIARWHSLDPSGWDPDAFRAPKPPVQQMARELLERRTEVSRLIHEAALPGELLDLALQQLEGSDWAGVKVLNHGDLHAGNYASIQGDLFVLDWEHVHLNSPLWDLYHLLDMSHPVFPRFTPRNEELRERILRIYVHQRRFYGQELEESGLLADYCAYACLFTLWMLLLIESDLGMGSVYWSRPQLLRQQAEAMDSLKGCGLQFLRSTGADYGENKRAEEDLDE
ncbi:hypothetical protein AWM70_20755 [Paenibacillus yonginensis]|uniref:Aminoglycoside phosphotransferase domain-containing protein n=1 Tax=Paenibacillus yonginensis TaxID=1462996 RepID=A0A1B1N5L2_9BACL|nr:phosphotransferase [Paenibacillus yonginensis]ANS76709.1 hypothetical protein AWM70_20755 [Paenibacillus yonginensis]